ncbi:MAG: hypothetical protein ACREF9_18685, partial [Opitutaceae bacterium]
MKFSPDEPLLPFTDLPPALPAPLPRSPLPLPPPRPDRSAPVGEPPGDADTDTPDVLEADAPAADDEWNDPNPATGSAVAHD